MIVGLTLVMVIPVSVFSRWVQNANKDDRSGLSVSVMNIPRAFPCAKAVMRWRTRRRHRKETRHCQLACFFVFVLSLDEETLSVACPVATTTSHHAQGDRGYPAFPRRNGWRGGKALNVEGSPHVQFGFGLRGVQPSSVAHGSVSASDVSIN